ncbi:MAG: threonine/serine exporter family protein [Eubacteriaceae bacterium]|jgi:uncharacterized membrane protein YjjP (DUF1212 family)|nr:threonine/serine exporter family protein [Eubacteriaceae bacterium]
MTIIDILNLGMSIGFLLLENGAEVYRVEESVRRVCQAYGYEDAVLFVVPTIITITVTGHDGTPYSKTKRVYYRKTDLHKVKLVNTLCRNITDKGVSYEEAIREIDRIHHAAHYSFLFQMVSLGVGAFFFSLFFNATLGDAIFSFFIGCLLRWVISFTGLTKTNVFFESIIGGMTVSILVTILSKFGFIMHPDRILMGSIMTLTPGLAMTNAMRDIMAGDLLAGLTKSTETILIAAGIALGVALPIILIKPLGGIL